MLIFHISIAAYYFAMLEMLKCWTLFVVLGSLMAMQFGKCGMDQFILDFRHPFSGLQAFGIALSGFMCRLGCEF